MKSTRAACEKFAAEHNLSLDYNRWKSGGVWCYAYSVDLPDGMITDDGNTGKGGEDEDGLLTTAQVWGYILADMKDLASRTWVPIQD